MYEPCLTHFRNNDIVLCFSSCFKVQALVDLWTANGKSVVEKLKQRSLAPKQVMNISLLICYDDSL